MNYNSSVVNMTKGREAYGKLDTLSDSKSALANFRKLYNSSVKAVRQKRERFEEEVKEIQSVYLPGKANPMIDELRRAFRTEVATHQHQLTDKLNSILKAKEDAVQAYISIPPTAEQFSLLQMLKLRGAKSIPEEEWSMLISTLAGNYQCATVLESLAKEAGKDFVIPFTPKDGLDAIQMIRRYAETAIQNITDPRENYIASEFMRDDVEDSYTSQLIAKLDSQIATTIPSESATLKGRLKQARDHALHQGAYDLFNSIADFIVSHNADFATEKEAALIDSAEALIEQGMNAKESQPKLSRSAESAEKAD